MLAALSSPPTDNGWGAMQFVVGKAVDADTDYSYKNANCALLAILNARLWKNVGGQVWGGRHRIRQSTNWSGDPIMKPVTTYKLLAGRPEPRRPGPRWMPCASRSSSRSASRMCACTAANSATDARAYGPNATDATKGSLLENAADECAGYRGLRLSSLRMVKVLANLRHGTLVDPADRALMDQQLVGSERGRELGTFRAPAATS